MENFPGNIGGIKKKEVTMIHLEDEDIARLIDGKISKNERKQFLEHLSGCDECLMIYNESLTFVQQDQKRKFFLKMPDLEKIILRFRQLSKPIFSDKRLILAYAVLLIGIILMPFLLLRENSQVTYIEESMATIEHRGSHSFISSTDPLFAAVRAGIFMEELSLLVDYGGKEELKGKLVRGLMNELKVIFNVEADSLLPDLVHVEEGTIETIEQRIRVMLEQRSFGELFQFGSFIEHSILGSFEDQVPNREQIEKYRDTINKKYKDALPEGVLRELNKFPYEVDMKENKEIFLNIKEIFLAVE
jgi:hypothetical protein